MATVNVWKPAQGLTTFETGDCGMGYAGTIGLISGLAFGTALSFFMMTITWLSASTAYEILLAPLVLNGGGVAQWIIGTVVLGLGIGAMMVKKDSGRKTLLNVWVIMLILFFCASFWYGVEMATNFRRPHDWLMRAGKLVGADLRKKLTVDSSGQYTGLGGDLAGYGMQIVMYEMYKVLPVPLNSVFFFCWQYTFAAFVFAVIPILLSFGLVICGMGVRNHFANLQENHDGFALFAKGHWGPKGDDDGSESDSSSSSGSSGSSSSSYSSVDAKRSLVKKNRKGNNKTTNRVERAPMQATAVPVVTADPRKVTVV